MWLSVRTSRVLKNGKLVALRSGSPLKDQKELPARLCVLPWGTHETPKGKVICNATTLAQLPGTQQRAGFDRIALDFNHATVKGTEFYQPEPQKVAAFGVPKVIAGEGIVLEDLQWTPEGKELALGGHYPDLSPTVLLNEQNEVIGIHSAALCRQGAVPGLTLFAADPAALFNFNPETAPTMNHKALLLAILGLGDDATDAEIEAAAKAFTKKATAQTDVTALNTAIEAALKPVTAKLTALETELTAKDRQAIVELACREGKVIPKTALDGDAAQNLAPLSNSQLRALVTDLPVTVPVEQRTPGKVAALASTGLGTTTTADEMIRKNLGISEEVWKKHNK